MRSDVSDPILWPDQVADLHAKIILQSVYADNMHPALYIYLSQVCGTFPPAVGSGTHRPGCALSSPNLTLSQKIPHPVFL